MDKTILAAIITGCCMIIAAIIAAIINKIKGELSPKVVAILIIATVICIPLVYFIAKCIEPPHRLRTFKITKIRTNSTASRATKVTIPKPDPDSDMQLTYSQDGHEFEGKYEIKVPGDMEKLVMFPITKAPNKEFYLSPRVVWETGTGDWSGTIYIGEPDNREIIDLYFGLVYSGSSMEKKMQEIAESKGEKNLGFNWPKGVTLQTKMTVKMIEIESCSWLINRGWSPFGNIQYEPSRTDQNLFNFSGSSNSSMGISKLGACSPSEQNNVLIVRVTNSAASEFRDNDKMLKVGIGPADDTLICVNKEDRAANAPEFVLRRDGDFLYEIPDKYIQESSKLLLSFWMADLKNLQIRVGLTTKASIKK